MLWAHTTSRKCLLETFSTSGEAGKFHLRCSHIETKCSGLWTGAAGFGGWRFWSVAVDEG